MTNNEVEKELFIKRKVDYLVDEYGVSRFVARKCFEHTSKVMTELGFEYVTTGGPCSAWLCELSDDHFMLVTTEYGDSEAIFMDRCCMVGVYHENGDYRNVELHYLRDFIEGWKGGNE